MPASTGILSQPRLAETSGADLPKIVAARLPASTKPRAAASDEAAVDIHVDRSRESV
jgi:hypothetical protein